MIPKAQITHWSAGAPWPTELQIEQDLVLSRLIVDIANHPLLGQELAFRGGTCLHKLHLPTALRYSEDLDYVRTSHGPVKEIMDAIRAVATEVGLAEAKYKTAGQMVTMRFKAPGESGGEMRVKIETNIAETTPALPRKTRPFEVASPWFAGTAEVQTFHIDDLTATKFRALYQRKKGRDLFDLWHTLVALGVDDKQIVKGLQHYLEQAQQTVFSYKQLADNLKAKLSDPDFASDLSGLVVKMPGDYALDSAADLVMERLGSRLAGAPDLPEIAHGAWRGD